MTQTSQRKSDHIQLAFKSVADGHDDRFYYEPLLNAHPTDDCIPEIKIGNKKTKLPLWASSMTGGSERASLINHRLAKACGEFGIGMGLGSCRIVLEDEKYFEDFNLRDKLGNDVPFMANLGIAQLEHYVKNNDYKPIVELVEALRTDGMIIHVNPLQEYLQPEGDVISQNPIETIKSFIRNVDFPVWVKEVGQGMGPQSLAELMKLPIQGIEFGAYGGTNFSKMESLRNEVEGESLLPLAGVGHTAVEMIDYLNEIYDVNPTAFEGKLIVISGGVKNFLDGYYLINKAKMTAIYAQALPFLKRALVSAEAVKEYIEAEAKGLRAAYTYLKIRK